MGTGIMNCICKEEEYYDIPELKFNIPQHIKEKIYKQAEEYAFSKNPNPKNYHILNEKNINGNLILLVKYPNCQNFEGVKILVYKEIKSLEELLNKSNNSIDPHFSNDYISPIARFKPNREGFLLAKKLCKLI